MVLNTHYILVLKPTHDHEYTLVFQRDALIHESKTTQNKFTLFHYLFYVLT